MSNRSNIDNAGAPQMAATNPAADVSGAEGLETVPAAPGLGPEVAQAAGGGVLPDLTLLNLEDLLNLDPTDDSGPAGRTLETEPLQASPEDGELPADLTSLDLDLLLELDLSGAELPTLLEVAGLSGQNQDDEGEQNGPPEGADPSTNPLVDDENEDDDELGFEPDFGIETSFNGDVAAVETSDPNPPAEDPPGNSGQGNNGNQGATGQGNSGQGNNGQGGEGSGGDNTQADSGPNNGQGSGPGSNNGQGSGADVAVAAGNNANGNPGDNAGGSANSNAGGNGSASENNNAGGSVNSNAGGNSGNVGGGSANSNAGGNSANVGGGNANSNAGGNSANVGGGNANSNAGGNSGNVGGGGANSSANSNAGGNSGSGAGAIAVAAAGITFPGGGELPVSITPTDIAPAADPGQAVPTSPPVSVPAGPPAIAPLAYSASTYVPSSDSNNGPGNSSFGFNHGAAQGNTSSLGNPSSLVDLPSTSVAPDDGGSSGPAATAVAAVAVAVAADGADGAGLTLKGSGGSDSLVGGDNADDLSGLGGNDTLEGGAGADTLSGGGGGDVLDGGAGADDLSGGGGGDVLVWDFSDINIDGGGGSDTLRVDSGDVDFTIFAGTITGIENVDLASDAGANALTLSVQDVLDMSGTDTLTISGDALDSLDAGSGWTDGGVSGGNQTYTQVVGLDTATLVVDTDVAVNATILV